MAYLYSRCLVCHAVRESLATPLSCSVILYSLVKFKLSIFTFLTLQRLLQVSSYAEVEFYI